jgi:hypothetical protein
MRERSLQLPKPVMLLLSIGKAEKLREVSFGKYRLLVSELKLQFNGRVDRVSLGNESESGFQSTLPPGTTTRLFALRSRIVTPAIKSPVAIIAPVRIKLQQRQKVSLHSAPSM